jgi:thiol-disulfide isomerase/thioredoxin
VRRARLMRARFMAAASLIAMSLALSGCFDSGSGGVEGPRRQAPGFNLTRLDGLPVALEDHLGKIVILDFWATWCAPCEVQMPVLDTLWKMRGGPDLMILGLSVDTDPAEDVSEWVEKRELDYPIAIASQDLAIDYGVLGFPTLVVIDPQGGIHTRHIGVLSRPELEDILEEIAAESRIEG